MKFTVTILVVLSLCSSCTAILQIPLYLANLAAGLAQQSGIIPPGILPVPAVSPVNISLAPADGLPPIGQLPGFPSNPLGLPGFPIVPTGNLPGGVNSPTGNLPTGNLPGGVNLPTGNLPGLPPVGKKIPKPKPTPQKLAAHQKCLETYFPPCANGHLFYCYLLHVCVKIY